MAKFKVNDGIVVKDKDVTGTVIYREEKRDVSSKHTSIKYLVRTEDGDFNWYERKDLERQKVHSTPQERIKTLTFKTDNGYTVTLVAIVENSWIFGVYYQSHKLRTLRIGVSICSPEDEYREEIGYKIARSRAYRKPFTHMTATFSGEFNELTVASILAAKATYINENIEHFVKK